MSHSVASLSQSAGPIVIQAGPDSLPSAWIERAVWPVIYAAYWYQRPDRLWLPGSQVPVRPTASGGVCFLLYEDGLYGRYHLNAQVLPETANWDGMWARLKDYPRRTAYEFERDRGMIFTRRPVGEGPQDEHEMTEWAQIWDALEDAELASAARGDLATRAHIQDRPRHQARLTEERTESSKKVGLLAIGAPERSTSGDATGNPDSTPEG
jgi:hypothetical protein